MAPFGRSRRALRDGQIWLIDAVDDGGGRRFLRGGGSRLRLTLTVGLRVALFSTLQEGIQSCIPGCLAFLALIILGDKEPSDVDDFLLQLVYPRDYHFEDVFYCCRDRLRWDIRFGCVAQRCRRWRSARQLAAFGSCRRRAAAKSRAHDGETGVRSR